MVKEEDETENSYRNSEKIRNAQGFFSNVNAML